MHSPSYAIYLNSHLVCQTSWPHQAQAAWNRAARDRSSSVNGGSAELYKDGVPLACVRPQTRTGHPWPDDEAPEANWHDVMRSLIRLLRDDDWSAREIANAMTAAGLSTSRSQIDSLRGSSQGSRRHVHPAEVVIMLDAVLRRYRGDE